MAALRHCWEARSYGYPLLQVPTVWTSSKKRCPFRSELQLYEYISYFQMWMNEHKLLSITESHAAIRKHSQLKLSESLFKSRLSGYTLINRHWKSFQKANGNRLRWDFPSSTVSLKASLWGICKFCNRNLDVWSSDLLFVIFSVFPEGS